MSLIRKPAVAGRFYPASPQQCTELLDALHRPIEARPALGVIMPHAGWVYSGPTALLSAQAVSAAKPETVVVFGAVHVPDPNRASLFPAGTWQTPLGELRVDEELARRVAEASQDVAVDPAAHAWEHSIEVELPLLQYLMGNEFMILPVMVRPGPWAERVGQVVAREAAELGRPVVFVGSTDLTHYGPAFGFEPAGRGEPGIRWAKEVNDRRFIRRVEELDAGGVVPEAEAHLNACGAGAVAATIAAVRELGADRYRELEHTTSADVERSRGERPLNSVGYEAGVFER